MVDFLLHYVLPSSWLVAGTIAAYYTVRATIVARAIALSVKVTLGGSDIGTAREALRFLQADMIVRGLDVRLLMIICVCGIGVIALLNLPFQTARVLTTVDVLTCFGLIAYKSHYELLRYSQSAALAGRIIRAEQEQAGKQ